MRSFRFQHVVLEGMALNLPVDAVSSAEIEDKLAPVYERLSVPFGTLEKLSGIKTRYLWPASMRPSVAATAVAQEAIEALPFGKEQIGCVINSSVTRDFFEPATAVLVHQNLGLDESVMAFDVTNACIGFSNGMLLIANMIERGQIKAGLVVSAETLGGITDRTFKFLLERPELTREEFLKALPTFTLGCGATAFVLAHESIAKSGHRFIGSIARSASQFSELCMGNGDFCVMQDPEDFNPLMETDSQKLIASAAKLGGRAWSDFSETIGWLREDVDHVYCHQVGRQVGEAFYREMGLDNSKEFIVYPRYGNLVSAALPSALVTGAQEKGMKTGDKIVLTAFGSGLNAIFSGLIW